MDARIRRLRPAEVPAVLAMVESVFKEYGLWEQHRCGLDDLRQAPDSYARRGGEFLVAEINGRVVGCGGLMPLKRGTAEVRRMYLLPKARGKGLGATLLRRLISAARRGKFSRLVLETSPRYQDAIALYLRNGFEACVLDDGGCCNVAMFRDLV
jgi:putative acetyltransferase